MFYELKEHFNRFAQELGEFGILFFNRSQTMLTLGTINH